MSWPEPSNLAKHLHDSIPRFTFRMGHASNQFAITEEYGESLLMMLAAVVGFAFLYILIEALVRCCLLSCSNGLWEKYQPKFSKALCLLLLAGCVALVFVGFNYNTHFSSATDKALTALDGGVQFYQTVKTDGLDLSLSGSTTASESRRLSSSPVPPAEIRNAAAQIATGLTNVVQQLDSYLSELDRVDFTRHVKVPSARADNVGMALYAFSLWIALAIIVLIVIFGDIKNQCGLFMADFTLELFVFVAWVVAAGLLVLSVGAADFCQKPASNILVAVPDRYADIAKYYVWCNNSATNPLDTTLQTASNRLTALNGPYSRIVAWNLTSNTDKATIAIVNRLDVMLNAQEGTLAADLSSLRGDLECPGLQGLMTDIVTAGCGDLLAAATFLFLTNFIIAAVFFALRYMTTCGACKSSRRAVHAQLSVNQFEYVRLVPTNYAGEHPSQ